MESHSWESPAGLLLRLAACRLVGLSRRYSVHAFHNPGEKKYTSTGSTYGAAQFITSYDYDPLCPQSYTVHSSLECLWWYVHHETNHQWNLHGYCRRVVLSREYGSAASLQFTAHSDATKRHIHHENRQWTINDTSGSAARHVRPSMWGSLASSV